MIQIIADQNLRIDKIIASKTELSRAEIKELITYGAVYVDEQQIRKSSFMVKLNAHIKITKLLSKITNVEAQNISLDIVFEDQHLMVINKPSGLVVHPAPGNMSGTLVNALMFHVKTLSNENGLLRPGIVHRIDKDTSGLLIIAKTNEAHRLLAQMLAKHEIKRQYYAITSGYLKTKTTYIAVPIGRSQNDRKKMIVTNINSKAAQTTVELQRVIQRESRYYSFVKCSLKTGRTHQIRVHLAYIKHPVLNDFLYGEEKFDQAYGQFLHAYALQFQHPITKQDLSFTTPLPQRFSDFLDPVA